MKVNYRVEENSFHGGGVISEHASLKAALRSLIRAEKNHGSDCHCGGPKIVRLLPGPLTPEEWAIDREEWLNLDPTGAFAESSSYRRYTAYLDDYNQKKEAEEAIRQFNEEGYNYI